MPVKSFLKVICVSAIGAGAWLAYPMQGLSQQELEDPGYGLHMQRTKLIGKEESKGRIKFNSVHFDRMAMRQRKATHNYEMRVSEVMAGTVPIDSSVIYMRVLYPNTPYYDPFAKKTIEELTAFAYTADVSDDPVEVSEALDSYRGLLRKHLVNLDVIEYALTLSQVNPIYGDPLRLKKIRSALHTAIIGYERDGSSPEEAYKVATYAEETYVLSTKNVTVKKSEIYEVGENFYNVHDVVYEDGEFGQIYIDMTWPIYMYELAKALRQHKNRVAIPLQ